MTDSSAYSMEPLPLVPARDLSIQANGQGLHLIVAGTARHYEFAYGEIPSHQVARKGNIDFYLNRNLADILAGRLMDPTYNPDLIRQLVESRSAFEYGYLDRSRGFRIGHFDQTPGWGPGFKVLRNGDATILYLCDCEHFDDSISITETMVELDAEQTDAQLRTIQSLLNPRFKMKGKTNA